MLVPKHKFFTLSTQVDPWCSCFVYTLVIAASFMSLSVFLTLRDVSYPELLHKRAIFICLCWTHTHTHTRPWNAFTGTSKCSRIWKRLLSPDVGTPSTDADVSPRVETYPPDCSTHPSVLKSYLKDNCLFSWKCLSDFRFLHHKKPPIKSQILEMMLLSTAHRLLIV